MLHFASVSGHSYCYCKIMDEETKKCLTNLIKESKDDPAEQIQNLRAWPLLFLGVLTPVLRGSVLNFKKQKQAGARANAEGFEFLRL